jgi:hypothetical protein
MADPSTLKPRSPSLHSVAWQEADLRVGDVTSFLRNGKYVFQIHNEGFLELYEVDEQKASQLRERLGAGRQEQLKFEAQLHQASKRSIWKFDLRAALGQAMGQADASAVPALPPRLILSAHEGELAVAGVLKAEESPGGVQGGPLPIWTLPLAPNASTRLHLLASGNLTVEGLKSGQVLWQTGTCGGVLRGCGELGLTK